MLYTSANGSPSRLFFSVSDTLFVAYDIRLKVFRPLSSIRVCCSAMFFHYQAEPQPDNDEHELQVASINEDIKKIKDDIEVFRAKIDEANEARRGQGVSSATYEVLRIIHEVRAKLIFFRMICARACACEGCTECNRAGVSCYLRGAFVV